MRIATASVERTPGTDDPLPGRFLEEGLAALAWADTGADRTDYL
ncbi:hypothetical protein SCYAM73S_04199 [Streptomyces cyaneofuscatus]